MKKLLVLILVLTISIASFAVGSGKGHIIVNPPPFTMVYQDTVRIYGSTSDTLDYQLFASGNFCNGYMKFDVRPDTASTAVTSTAKDSLYFITYSGSVNTFDTNCDTLLFNDQASRTAGLVWTAEKWYFANIGNITNPLPRTSVLRMLINQVSSGTDSIDVIIRFEIGMEK